jgi:hypothetical protein
MPFKETCEDRLLISHKRKVIFVHVPKCAGQSVELLFVKDQGLTWEERAPLLLRRNRDEDMGPHRLAHLYAEEYYGRGHISKADFDAYFKFAFVRNPLARILSEMNYRRIRKKTGVFSRGFRGVEQFVKWALRKPEKYDVHRHVVPQVRYLYDRDLQSCLVDRIVKLEEAREVFPELTLDIFGAPMEMPKKNESRERVWTSEGLSDRDRQFIREFYKEDFRILGYDT